MIRPVFEQIQIFRAGSGNYEDIIVRPEKLLSWNRHSLHCF